MKEYHTKKSSRDPAFSIAICTYRRYDMLALCLEAIRNMERPEGGFLVIVEDNGLQPREAKSFFNSIRDMPDVRYSILDRAGLSYARNRAIEHCQTHLLAMVDDDSMVEKGWGVAMVAAHRRHELRAGAIGGKVVPIWTVECPAWLDDSIMSYMTAIDWGPKECEIDSQYDNKWLVGTNVMYNVPAIREVGGFNEHLGRTAGEMQCHEELDLHIRLSRAGYKIFYAPDAVVRHYIHANRVDRDFLVNLGYNEGLSRAIMEREQGRGVKDSAEMLSLTGAFLNPSAIRESRLFSDTEDPKIFANKMGMLSQLGYCLQHAKQLLDTQTSEGMTSFAIPASFPISSDKCSDFEFELPPLSIKRCEVTNIIYIVMPVRNAAATIEDSLNSIIAQEGDFEVWLHVQDGASIDGTVEIVRRHQARIASVPSLARCRRFKLTLDSNPDAGMYDAVARGVEFLVVPDNAFMTYLNGDDIMCPGAISHVLAMARQHPEIHWVCGTTSNIDEEGQEILCARNSYSRYLLYHGLCDSKWNPFVQQEGTFWRGWLWRQVGGVDRTLRLAGDYSLWCRFAAVAELYSLQFPLASFRLRPGSLSGNNMDQYNREVDTICDPKERDKAFTAMRNFLLNNGRMTFPTLRYHTETGEYAVVPEDILTFMPWLKSELPQREHAMPMDVSNRLPPDVYLLDDMKPPPYRRMPFSPCGRNWERSSWFRRLRHRLRAYWKIHRSGLFFATYYVQRYPDVGIANMNPLWHYIVSGDTEGRSPNPLFDPAWYRARYPDVRERPGLNTLWHFLKRGAREGRDPSPRFRTMAYLNARPDLRGVKINPLAHYLRYGIHETNVL